jgi:FlaA1/EpsC-like NDP-sugar epimerase
MKFETYLLVAMLLFGVWKTHRSVQRSQSAQERFFAIRASALTWLVSVMLATAFLFLPNKQRVLLLLPAFVVVVTLAKLWRNARVRLRRESQGRVDIERMKRVN